MTAKGGIRRKNMTQCEEEPWRPPVFTPVTGRLDALVAALRRTLDLQAGSIWRDLERVVPNVGGTLLDVGCGAQPYRPLVSTGTKYIGIDTINAREHFGYEIPDTRYFTGNIWPIDDASIDCVLCTETLEHVAEPLPFLREAFRCLAPGGTLLLTVPFAARWHFIPHDYWRYTPSALSLLLSKAGLLNVRVYARGNALTVACYKNMALILRLLIPNTPFVALRLALQVLSLPCIPFLAIFALIANISLLGDGGNDCLGYTVIAEKKAL
jgi:SAM-dependent methyltransferase